MFKKLIYLASPYSHEDPNVVTKRYIDTVKATAKLIDQGHLIFSPIVHSHHVAEYAKASPLNPTEGELSDWMNYDLAFIDKCDEVWALMLPGWSKSRGVAAELSYARAQGIPRRYISPDTLDVSSARLVGLTDPKADEGWGKLGEAEKQRIDEALEPIERPAYCTGEAYLKALGHCTSCLALDDREGGTLHAEWCPEISDPKSRTIIGLTGHARSGKDTAGKYLVENHGFTRIGLADAVKEALYALDPNIRYPESFKCPTCAEVGDRSLAYLIDCGWGWDRLKSEYTQVRELLQRMGTEVGRNIFGENCWIDIAQRKIEALGPDARVVITDVRFPNEAEWVRSLGGEVWMIEREGYGPVNEHSSDQRLPMDYIDQIIANVAGLDLFYAIIESGLTISDQLKGQAANV